MAHLIAARTHEIFVNTGSVFLKGDLCVPEKAKSVVVFAHGSGSSRFSPRNRYVAEALQKKGIATLLMDLLPEEMEVIGRTITELRFDIKLLAERLRGCAEWLQRNASTRGLPIGYFGASTGAAAALVAAAQRPDEVFAVVSRGGRPDLARDFLPRVKAPTLFIVGGDDPEVLSLNREAAKLMRAEHHFEIVPGATHLFEEPGTLEIVARLAADWFAQHVPSSHLQPVHHGR